VYNRELWRSTSVIAGPAVIEEFGSFTMVLAGWAARRDGLGNLVLERTP
jgi:5-oxoprolinase (ATP-hydrolysing)